MSVTDALSRAFPLDADIPGPFQLKEPLEQRYWLLDGKDIPWDGEMQTVVSPIETGVNGEFSQKVLGRCPVLTPDCGEMAVKAVLKAYDSGRGAWPSMPVSGRIAHVEEFLRRMLDKRDEVVKLLMWEICKSYADSCKEFDRTVEYARASIEDLKELDRNSSRFAIVQGIYAMIRRAPLGPVLCMGPYNYPLNETFATLIPALLMGNPVIVKTPRIGKMLYAALMDAFRESFPPGVVNVLFGDRRVVTPVMKSGALNVLAFIGSSQAADAMRVSHPHPHRLRCVLGLDAKNAAIVMDDADMDIVAAESLAGALSFNGQRCTALKMFYVHEKRVDEFLERLDAGIGKLKCGMPWEDGVKITPLPVPGKPAYLDGLIEDAAKNGAKVVNKDGGTSVKSLYYPAVVSPCKNTMRLNHEEQFGPVIPVASFSDLSEPVDAIVNSHFGQQMSIFSSDPETVGKITDHMVNQVSRVNINSQCERGPDVFPFTGRKDSAEGTLSVHDALRSFSIRSLAAAKGSEANKALLKDIVRNRRSNFLSNDFLF